MVMILWLIGFALASPRIEIHLGADRIKIGQTLVLEVILTDISALKPPAIPVDYGLTIASSNQSPKRRFVRENGRDVSILTYRYHVTALLQGDWRIGPVNIAGGSRSVRGEEKILRVDTKGQLSEEMSVAQATLSVPSPYAGQTLWYHLRFHSDMKALARNWSPPSFSGLRPMSEMSPFRHEHTLIDNDKEVDVLDIKVPLVAGNPGEYQVSTASVLLQMANTSSPAPLPGIQSRLYRSQTNAFRGQIRSLPTPPSHFSGLVGAFDFHLEPSRLTLQASETLSITLTIRGIGDLSGYRHSLDLSGFRAYAESPSLKVEFNETGVYSVLSQTWALAPEFSGSRQIPPESLTVFNPNIGRYEQLSTPPFTIEVTAAKKREMPPATNKSTPPLQTIEAEPANTEKAFFWWFVLLALGGGIGLAIYRFFRRLRPETPVVISFPSQISSRPKVAAGQLLWAMRAKVGQRKNMSPESLCNSDFFAISKAIGNLYDDLNRVRFGDGQIQDCIERLRGHWKEL